MDLSWIVGSAGVLGERDEDEGLGWRQIRRRMVENIRDELVHGLPRDFMRALTALSV